MRITPAQVLAQDDIDIERIHCYSRADRYGGTFIVEYTEDDESTTILTSFGETIWEAAAWMNELHRLHADEQAFAEWLESHPDFKEMQ